MLEIGYSSTGEAATGLSLATNLAGHARGVGAVGFAADTERHLCCAAKDATWSIVATNKIGGGAGGGSEPRELARGSAPASGGAFELVALSPMAKRLVGATAQTLSIIHVTKGGGQLLETVPATGHVSLSALALSADGLRALTAGDDGRLRLWKVDEEEQAGRI